MSEVWLPVPGFYLEASSEGRVRSTPRTIVRKNGAPQFCPGKVLTPNPGNKYGHLYVTARAIGSEKQNYYAVHALVALAFHGPRPDGQITRHEDGDLTNNRPSNLKYGTYTDNKADEAIHGRGRARLLRHEVDTMRVLKLYGVKNKDLSRMFSIDPGQVSKICSGKSWVFEE